MRKIYITKEDLVNEIEAMPNRLFKNKNKPAGPFAYIAVSLLLLVTLMCAIPMMVSWLLILILYIPGYAIDSIIVNYFIKGKK